MSRPAQVALVAVLLVSSGRADAPLAWRFGLEDTTADLTGAQRDLLMSKLEALTVDQAAGGDVNVNGLAGGWHAMQPDEGGGIDFSESDALVRLLQARGFSMLWNLRLNSGWASAGNPDCYGYETLWYLWSCAPDADHEDDLAAYVAAVVERYDGDGNLDMGHETPQDPDDDLVVPVRFYLMTGEIEFAGATPVPQPGYGDEALNHFWPDSIPNLLRTHRIVYEAVHAADPTGATRLVSSGGVLWDLYADFPDWPQVEGSTVQARLTGDNNHGALYVESHARLVEMLSSFEDDSDGVECDYIGWHPHMAWREIDQTFAFLRAHAPSKPIYVDDMWTNIFLQQRPDAPGNTLFSGGGAAMEGDFPNPLVASYPALVAGMHSDDEAVHRWYHARTARNLVKAFASAFGEGAERVGFSGIADPWNALAPWLRLGPTGWINLMGTLPEGYPERPAYWTLRMLVAKLHDFTSVAELTVSSDPRTRVYRFERPRGPIWIGWSETGGAPPALDYDLATGESVSFSVDHPSLLQTRIVDEPGETEPETAELATPGGMLTVQLGYEPLLVEWPPLLADGFESGDTSAWSLTVP